MEIKLLDKSIYAGYPVTIDYVSEYYFDVEIIGGDDEFNIRMIKKNFGYLYHHQGNADYERLYEKWIDNSRAFGVFDNDRLIGVMELGDEWNGRLFINILWVDEKYRRLGIGKMLVNKAKDEMKDGNYRMLVLETQSSNYGAICFYLKQGFKLIGFDSTCYGNDDITKKEVRLNFGYEEE